MGNMTENNNVVKLPSGELVELSNDTVALFGQGAYFFERWIYRLYVNSGGKHKFYDVKSFFEYHKKKNTDVKDIAQDMRFTPKGQLWVDIKNPLFIYWLQQIYAPKLRRVEFRIDGRKFEMPEGLWLSCEEEVLSFEEHLVQDNDLRYYSLSSYFEYYGSNNTFDEAICEELKSLGFKNLADKYGIAWIWQIYLPRVKASCFCRH